MDDSEEFDLKSSHKSLDEKKDFGKKFIKEASMVISK